MENGILQESKFQFNGDMIKRRLKSFFPAMLLTNLSTLLLVTVDGIVVGNMVGGEALASVNIFAPATTFISVISTLVSSGAGARLSESMGSVDMKQMQTSKSTLKFLMIIMAVFVALIQMPIVWGIISSYDLTPEMNDMTWSYATGVMISMPFGLISTVGVMQLQIVGKANTLMWLSALEGGVNLVLDILFVGPLGMGVAGAGYGTACANIIRCTATVICIARTTDMYKSGDAKPTVKESKRILLKGLPEAANSTMLALQSYFMMSIIISACGESGGEIKGVWSFVASLAVVLIGGVQGSIRPMTGLLTGIHDYEGLHRLIKHGLAAVFGLVGGLTILIELFPELIYTIHGVKVIPEGGELSLRLASLSLVFIGFNTLFRMYFTNRDELKFSTILTIIGKAALPVCAFILMKTLQSEWIWFSYLITELLMFIVYVIYYARTQAEDWMTLGIMDTDMAFTVNPKDAVEISDLIRKTVEENKVDPQNAFKVALCVEEMVAYAEKADASTDVTMQILIRFQPDSAMLVFLDDGKGIFLDNQPEAKELVTNNYDLIRKMSRSMNYQYILNMNFTVCKF